MRRSMLCSAAAVAVFAVILLGLGHNKAYTETKPEYVGSAVCAGCHSDINAKLMPTVHGQTLKDPRRPKEESGCEACHGPGSAHLADSEHKSIINPAKEKPQEAAKPCFGCHKKDVKEHNWQTTAHARGKMNCSSCHDVHAGKGQYALRKPQMELCLDCHKKESGQFQMTSHHPLFEGRITCSDCHDVHKGTEDYMLSDSPEKDLCVRCHREKEGPFNYEHAAVSDGFGEGCLSCHRAHGSPNNDLQRLTGRGLCVQCHTDVHIGSPSAQTAPNCTTCHRMIHGSDRDEHFFN